MALVIHEPLAIICNFSAIKISLKNDIFSFSIKI